MTTTTTPKTKTQEILEGLVDKVVDSISRGEAGEWSKPWTQILGGQGLPANAKTHKAYQGINTLVLWVTAIDANYPYQLWATYKQWQSLDAQVRKGETGTQLVKWGKTYTCDGEGHKPHKGRKHCPNSEHLNGAFMWANTFTVFNVAQVDGYELDLPDPTFERWDEIEDWVGTLGVKLNEQPSNQAFYKPTTDEVTVPLIGQFDSPRGYYGTLFHELTHWTGAEHRLNRETGRMFGDGRYANEELVAELGSVYLAAHWKVEVEPHMHHAAYLANWLKALKDDPMDLYRAARDASQAADYLLGQAQGTDNTEEE